MLTFEQNVRAILECQFAGFEKEIIEAAVNQIVHLDWSIEVGDEIRVEKLGRVAVTGEDANYYYGIQCGGKSCAISKHDSSIITTKSYAYPQVKALLKEMGED